MMLTYDWFRRRMERLKGNLIPKDEQQELDTKGTIFALSQGVDVFQAILKHPNLCEAFSDFLTSQWCVENLLFYKAVETYREKCSAENANVRLLAQAVAVEYIMNGASLEVNLDYGVKKTALREVEEMPSVTTFDEAQVAIYNLMERDSFGQWQRTGDFKKALQAVVDRNSTDKGSKQSKKEDSGRESSGREHSGRGEENAGGTKLKTSPLSEEWTELS